MQLTSILFLVFAGVLAFLHWLASSLLLYWRYWWFDIPMHLLGGVVLAFGFFTFVDLRVVPKRYAARSGIILLFVLFVAILWEFFENFIGLAGFSIEHNYVLDTAIDLVMGLLGGVVGIFIGKQLRN